MTFNIECDECNEKVESVFCEKHLEEKIIQAYADGKKEGFHEGYQKRAIES